MEKFHPEWEILFFNDGDCRDFVIQEFPELQELFDWYPRQVMRADLFRLLAVYRMGGFYLDTDLKLETSLDPLLTNAAVFATEQELSLPLLKERYPSWMWSIHPRLTLANYAFGAISGHPFLKEIIHELVVRSENFDVDECKDLDVLHATGPEALTSVYYRERDRWGDVKILQRTGARFGEYGRHLVHSGWRMERA